MLNTHLRGAFAALLLSATGMALNGCSAYMHQPITVRPARLGEETPVTGTLRTLPVPKEKIFAAVYKFRDLTGQYKQAETGGTFSTAVTQGTTNILLKALEESGWFVPIERENVSNLLNERKIIRSSMAQFKNENDNLPPLLFAGLIMEGGVVSYDANVITGGAGLRYFGTGGSTQYRQDRVTVYLRAVATKTGKILKTIYTSKTILSQSGDAGIFRFVNFKRLLEAETGFTRTEPAQMAVTEAIEKAVYSMVIEGIRDSLWSSAPKSIVTTQTMLKAYEQERTDMSVTDPFGSRNLFSAPRLVIHPFGSLWRYQGDYVSPVSKTGYGASLELHVAPHWAVQATAGTGTLASKYYVNTDVTTMSGGILYRMLPYERFTPLLYAGVGTIRQARLPTGETINRTYTKLNGGIGLEYRFSQLVGLRVSAEYQQPLTDALDGKTVGSRNDYYLQANGGLILAIGRVGRRTSTPLLRRP